MKIKQITSQSRRDFTATMECEHCGHIVHNMSGYDDENFHKNVIPKIKCSNCNKISPEEYRPLTTKYGAHEVI